MIINLLAGFGAVSICTITLGACWLWRYSHAANRQQFDERAEFSQQWKR